MNIFILDDDIDNCVKYHCDKHVVKMLTEYVQLLSSAVRISGIDAGYKVTHKNHPCAIWARESLDNWRWLKSLSLKLGDEYYYRYGQKKNKRHGAELVLKQLPEPNIPIKGITPFPICVTEDCKADNTVDSYRLFYKNHKAAFAKWTNREIPFFMQ
jgi:hypothetical protein